MASGNGAVAAVDDDDSVDHVAVSSSSSSSSCNHQNNVDDFCVLTSSSSGVTTTRTTATTRTSITSTSEPSSALLVMSNGDEIQVMETDEEDDEDEDKQDIHNGNVNDHHDDDEAGDIKTQLLLTKTDTEDNHDDDDDDDDCQDKKKAATKNNQVKANGQADELPTTVASTTVKSPYYENENNESADSNTEFEFESSKAATIQLEDQKEEVLNDLIHAVHQNQSQTTKQHQKKSNRPLLSASEEQQQQQQQQQQESWPGAHHTTTPATATEGSGYWASIPPPLTLPNTRTTAAQQHQGPGAFRVTNNRTGGAGDDDDVRTITYGDGHSTTDNPGCTSAESSNNAVVVVSARLAPAERSHYIRGQQHHQHHHQHQHFTRPQIVNPTGDIIVTAEADTSISNNQVDDPEYIKMQRKRQYLTGCSIAVLLLVVLLLSLGLAGIFRERDQNASNKTSSTQSGGVRLDDVNNIASANTTTNETTSAQTETSRAFSPTLAKIKAEGILNCAYNTLPGRIYPDLETGEITGINALMCVAIGAAIFGPNTPSGFSLQNEYHTVQDNFGTNFTDKYQAFNDTYPRIEWVDFNPFQSGKIGKGQIWTGVAHNMERHVHENYFKLGFSFSSPFLFDGGYISGIPHFLECVESKQFKHIDECSGLSVCVQKGTSYEGFLREKLPNRLIHFQASYMETWVSFANGTCPLIIHDETEEALETLNQLGYTGEFQNSKMLYSKEPIAMATLKGDPIWDDFVNAVVQSLLVAEQRNITQATAHLFPQTNVFGEEYKDMFRNSISAVGNFGELYQYSLAQFFPRAPQNKINNGNTPLLYSPLLGRLEQVDHSPTGPRLQGVLERGRLHCGVRPDRTGFVVQDDTDSTLLAGMDVDYCRAIASGLFGGDMDSVDYILLSEDPGDGYIKLANEEVDVIAGATLNLANDVREPASGLGFAFSLPYFYGYGDEEDNLCLATMQDDQDWSTFVYWIVASTIYAEERGIAQANSNAMPLIYVFGSGLQRMFRDVIDAVGNYGEMYNHSLEEIIPRLSIPRNHLNNESNFGPQLYPMPGLVS